MNEILNDVEELKDLIIDSDEYKEYVRITEVLDKNNEINSIINDIKRLQKKIVHQESKKEDTSENEKKLSELFEKLNSFEEYNNYLISAKKLNNLITDIQKKFEVCFNEILG